MSNEIIIRTPQDAIADVKRVSDIVYSLRQTVFKKDVDYGIIPGTGDKPVLLLPGMEKILRALNLRAEYHLVSSIEDFDKPLFFYRYECRLVEIDTGIVVGTAIGSANSMEAKWAYRWVAEDQVPAHLDKTTLPKRDGKLVELTFAVDKAETTGQYGKSEEYWQQFRDAIANNKAHKVKKQTKKGTYDAWEIDGTLYRIPNPDTYDQVNTFDKIAQKRALGAVTKSVANTSELFSGKLEDMTYYGVDDVVDADYAVVDPDTGEISEAAKPAAAPKSKSAPSSKPSPQTAAPHHVSEPPEPPPLNLEEAFPRTKKWDGNAVYAVVKPLFEARKHYDNYMAKEAANIDDELTTEDVIALIQADRADKAQEKAETPPAKKSSPRLNKAEIEAINKRALDDYGMQPGEVVTALSKALRLTGKAGIGSLSEYSGDPMLISAAIIAAYYKYNSKDVAEQHKGHAGVQALAQTLCKANTAKPEETPLEAAS